MGRMDRRIRRKGQEGQALVEFALVIPFLLLLMFGLIEFGLLLYNQQVITNASREGARYGIVSRPERRTLEEIRVVVDSYAGSRMITFGSDTPTTTMETTGTSFGDDLTVNVTFEYQFLVLPQFVGTLAGVQELRARTVMKYE